MNDHRAGISGDPLTYHLHHHWMNDGLQITARVLGSGVYLNEAEVASADQAEHDDAYGDGGGEDYDSAVTTPVPTAAAHTCLRIIFVLLLLGEERQRGPCALQGGVRRR